MAPRGRITNLKGEIVAGSWKREPFQKCVSVIISNISNNDGKIIIIIISGNIENKHFSKTITYLYKCHTQYIQTLFSI